MNYQIEAYVPMFTSPHREQELSWTPISRVNTDSFATEQRALQAARWRAEQARKYYTHIRITKDGREVK